MAPLFAFVSLLTPPATAGIDCSAVETIRTFAAAADARDAATLESVLHPDFRVVFTRKGGTEASLLPRAAWFKMLADGKIGGVSRDLSVLNTSTERGLTTVTATLQGDSGRFESTFTVVRDATGCRIVQDAVVFTPPA